MQIPENVLKYAPWSYSGASTAIACPAAFLRAKGKEKKSDEEPLCSKVGKTVHRILERALMGAPVNNCFRIALDENEDGLTQEGLCTVKTFREAVEDFMVRFAQMEQHRGPWKAKEVEKKFAITPEFEKTDFFAKKDLLYRGVIDLALVTRDNRAIVIDHKTGIKRMDEKHSVQLNSYAVVADILYKDLHSIRGAIHYVGADKDAQGKRSYWLDEVSLDHVRQVLRQELIDFLTEAANSADRGPIATKSWKCDFCDYRSNCNA